MGAQVSYSTNGQLSNITRDIILAVLSMQVAACNMMVSDVVLTFLTNLRDD